MLPAIIFTEVNRPDWAKWNVGDRVKHCGTKQWGTIQKIVPQNDKTAEILVQRDEPLCVGMKNDPTWWGSYHVMDHTPKESANE